MRSVAKHSIAFAAVVAACAAFWPDTALASFHHFTVGGWSGKPQLPGVGYVTDSASGQGPDWAASGWNCYQEFNGGVRTVIPPAGESCNPTLWEIPLEMTSGMTGAPRVAVYNADKPAEVLCDWDIVSQTGSYIWDAGGLQGYGAPQYEARIQLASAPSSVLAQSNTMFVTCSLPQIGDQVLGVDWVTE